MKDARLVKSIVFGMMEGTNKRGRPTREWLDDIQEWCGKRVDDICKGAMNRINWNKCVDRAVNTNGQYNNNNNNNIFLYKKFILSFRLFYIKTSSFQGNINLSYKIYVLFQLIIYFM